MLNETQEESYYYDYNFEEVSEDFKARLVSIIVCCCCGVIALAGNAIRLMILSCFKPRDHNKTYEPLYISVTLSDLGLLAVLPFAVAAMKLNSWPLGEFSCEYLTVISFI